ncbi:hypothetical protein JCM5350_003826, partial [Sporobolomyces pararoseus]
MAKNEIADFASSYSRDHRLNMKNEKRRLEDEIAGIEESTFDPDSNARWLATRDRLQQLDEAQTKTLYLRTGFPYYSNSTSNAHTLHQRLAARKSSSTFKSLKLSADDAATTDLATALSLAHKKFSAHFTPSPRLSSEVDNARSHFLDFVSTSSPTSDPRFARRWDPLAAARLDSPITSEEVKSAILSSPSSSSPGHLGLPYEFYRQNAHLLAPDLAAAYNSAWERGFLPPSQTEARVRLLFKFNKPNADPSLLSHYRPISLRETDYRLLARILVARLNPLLVKSIPRSQIGFVPGRDSSEAGLHLQLLLEEIQQHDLPGAALLSLDQESAYDFVDHRWILDCYQAFGAPPHFLRLLSAIYDTKTLRARYNINGFFTEAVPLRCGLPQGCPLSCASWLLSFQPFLDSLVRRRIALTLPSPIASTRPEIITSLAFADDSIAIVENLSSSLPKLHSLSVDWKLATNGRLNPGKTVATAIGRTARDDPLASETIWTELEDFAVWAGFPLSLSPQPSSFYHLLLEKVRRKTDAAAQIYSTPRTRSIYANTHILSLVLHSLSFYPAPSSFLDDLQRLIVEYVWNGSNLRANKEIVFTPVKKGGLGLIDPLDVDEANNLRKLNSFLAGLDPLWHDLALESFHRNVRRQVDKPMNNPWALFRSASFLKITHPLWKAFRSAASHAHVALRSPSTAEILSIPPSLFLSHRSLREIFSVSELFTDDSRSYTTLPPLLPSIPHTPSHSTSKRNTRLAWQVEISRNPILSTHFPSPIPSIALPSPSTLTPASFTFLNLDHGFSTAEARSALLSFKPSSQVPSIFLSLHSHTSEEDLRRTWTWIPSRPATPREADTHWRVLHQVIMTRSRQFEM